MFTKTIMYKFFFARALIKFHKRDYKKAYGFSRDAVRFASNSNFIVSLFSAYIAILMNNDIQAAQNLKEYLNKRRYSESNGTNIDLNSHEEIWIKAFGDYLTLCFLDSFEGFDTDRPLNLVEPAELMKINFEAVRSLYIKMFPTHHLVKIREKLELASRRQ